MYPTNSLLKPEPAADLWDQVCAVVEGWHGKEVFDLYRDHSPEMKRLLDVYYTREGGIPQVEAHRLIGARAREEREAVDAVLSEFFKLVDGVWRQDRCDREIARFQEKQAKARAAADARWAESGRNADASTKHAPRADAKPMRTHSEGNATRAPVPSLQTPDTTLAPKVQRGRGTRLPPDWEPGEAGFAFAAKAGLINGRAQAEFEKFKDHWAAKTGQNATKADWQAAWRNWVRKALEFNPSPPDTAAAEHQRSAATLAQMEADRQASQTPEARAAAAAARQRINAVIKRAA